MAFVPEHIRQAQDRERFREVLQHRGGDFRHPQTADLQELESLPLRPQLLTRVDVDPHRAR